MKTPNVIELLRRETGQTMSEYGVVLGVIVLAAIAAIGVLGLAISGDIGAVATKIGSLH